MNWFKRIQKRLTEPVDTSGPIADEPVSNFTPRACQVLALARKEACRLNHNFVGTEHVLLGLIALEQGVAVNVLKKSGLSLERLRLEVERAVGTGPDQKIIGNIPYTPRVKKVLALAAKEAHALNHTYVGTEHFLLGLLREGDGVAARVLRKLNIDVEQARREILQELDPNLQASDSTTPNPESPPQASKPATPETCSIDTNKRYDVYCSERNQNLVVYCNALFKGVRKLFPQDNAIIEFLELEQENGHQIFVSRFSVIKFCEPGQKPESEIA